MRRRPRSLDPSGRRSMGQMPFYVSNPNQHGPSEGSLPLKCFMFDIWSLSTVPIRSCSLPRPSARTYTIGGGCFHFVIGGTSSQKLIKSNNCNNYFTAQHHGHVLRARMAALAKSRLQEHPSVVIRECIVKQEIPEASRVWRFAQ